MCNKIDSHIQKDLSEARVLLESKGYTCVIKKDKDIYTSTERGVKPLLNLLDEKKNFKGYAVADKVVGKAAAYLYVLLGVDAIFAKVISVPAEKVLKKYGISVEYENKVEAIRNRTDTGFCPMETAVWDVEEPMEALKAIRIKLGS